VAVVSLVGLRIRDVRRQLPRHEPSNWLGGPDAALCGGV
jgi:hypothetical protein